VPRLAHKESTVLKEFREFIMRGNVLDLAIAVIIGGAFGKIVTSLVNDVIMPLIGMVVGGRTNFTDYFIALDGAAYESLQVARDAGAPVLAYGAFFTTVLDFLIVALVIFFMVRTFNRLKSAPPPPTPESTTQACPYCISTIPIKARRCPFCTSELSA
jgi:large conductance mechanosensitive channel